jgi:hypothetical protein
VLAEHKHGDHRRQHWTGTPRQRVHDGHVPDPVPALEEDEVAEVQQGADRDAKQAHVPTRYPGGRDGVLRQHR